MKRKPFLTTGALFMGIMIVLGTIGIVNGLWSKTLQINGTVTTGDLNTDWNCAYTNDDAATTVCAGAIPDEAAGDTGADPNNYDWPNFTDFSAFERKDVGECRVALGDQDFGNQVATVTINNAYPSYECTITLELSNTGSIPFNVIGSAISLTTPLELLNVDASTDGSGECSVPLQQIDPGEDETMTCTVHVMQAAAQSTCTGTTAASGTTPPFPVVTENCGATPQSYSFNILVCVAQWNEAATYEQCVGNPQREGPPAAP